MKEKSKDSRRSGRGRGARRRGGRGGRYELIQQ